MLNGVLAQLQLMVAVVDPQTHPVVIPPVPKCIDRIDILSSWAESLHWFPDLWSEGYYRGKIQMEAMRTAST